MLWIEPNRCAQRRLGCCEFLLFEEGPAHSKMGAGIASVHANGVLKGVLGLAELPFLDQRPAERAVSKAMVRCEANGGTERPNRFRGPLAISQQAAQSVMELGLFGLELQRFSQFRLGLGKLRLLPQHPAK